MPNVPAYLLEPVLTNEAITNKWEEAGLLEGLNNIHKPLVAGYFEEAITHILATDSWNQNLRAQLILPVIRRLMFDHDTLNIREVQKNFDYFFENEMREQIAEYDAQGIDGQAESVYNFCLDYSKPFDGRLKKLKKLKY